jgi:hypothetical protein
MTQFLFESKPFRQYRGWNGALGTGLGTALGIKLARPGYTVVCVIGDGAFHYNPVPAELRERVGSACEPVAARQRGGNRRAQFVCFVLHSRGKCRSIGRP